MAIKTLIFDFGNVIGHFSRQVVTERLAAHSPLPAPEVHARVFENRLEEDFESGKLTPAEFLRTLRETCQLCCDDDFMTTALADMFWPNDEVCALVPRLKPRHRLLLASNTNELHARHFRRQFAATLGLFDALVLSHEIGARKPGRAFYEHCQRLAHCRPDECLFIDDLPANIDGGRALGWHGVVYHGYAELRDELGKFGVAVRSAPAPGR